ATVNYIDRQVIGILKPTLQDLYHWSEIDYSNIVFAFTPVGAAKKHLDKINAKTFLPEQPSEQFHVVFCTDPRLCPAPPRAASCGRRCCRGRRVRRLQNNSKGYQRRTSNHQ